MSRNINRFKQGTWVKIYDPSSKHHNHIGVICGPHKGSFIPIVSPNFPYRVNEVSIEGWNIDPIFKGLNFCRFQKEVICFNVRESEKHKDYMVYNND